MYLNESVYGRNDEFYKFNNSVKIKVLLHRLFPLGVLKFLAGTSRGVILATWVCETSKTSTWYSWWKLVLGQIDIR